jgi:hypothetical protein
LGHLSQQRTPTAAHTFITSGDGSRCSHYYRELTGGRHF